MSVDGAVEEVASMDVVILRVIHIGSGMFWVGGFYTFFLFVQPAAVAMGPMRPGSRSSSSTIGVSPWCC